MSVYPVNEVFISIKGEGKDIGKKACFVRLYGCNLDCAFCDTQYATKGNNYVNMDVDEILAHIPKGLPVTITGGEPLMYNLDPFLKKLLRREGREGQIEIETNGTLFKKLYYVDCTVSPKLAYMTDDYKESLSKFEMIDSTFKFVIGNKGDFDNVMDLVDEMTFSNVVLMPEGITPERIIDVSRNIALWLIERKQPTTNVQLIPRLHILLWGNERGK